MARKKAADKPLVTRSDETSKNLLGRDDAPAPKKPPKK
jgi:hypothetical protein